MDTRKSFTDDSLLLALRADANPDDAIRYLYRAHGGRTMAYILKNTGNEQDAEDILQELILTFIELVKKDKFREESSVATFLYALTRNIWLNELKKRGRAKIRDEKFETGTETTGADISQFMIHREMKAQLLQLVGSVGETCKKILLAFYYDNLPMKEILQTLDYENEQVVRNKKYKCLKQLEQLIANQPNLAKNLKSVLLYE